MSAAKTITTTIEDALHLLHDPGVVFEIRIPKTTRAGTVSGYFDDRALAAAAIPRWDGKAPGIYVTLNPVDPAVMGRAANRLNERAKDTTSDKDVTRRRWLLVDVDYTRPAGISATDEEMKAAGTTARQIKAYLEDERGWPEGMLVHSGNGAHLLYRIDLPNDPASRDLVKRVLAALAKQFDADGVRVDTTVFNAARIAKVPGTMACKGDNLPERPHRRSRFLTKPEAPTPVPVDLMLAVSGTVKSTDKGRTFAGGNGHPFDVEAFIDRHLVVGKHKSDAAGEVWELRPCPFNAEHDQGEAFIRRDADGTLSAGCQHDSCVWQWAELREHFEPGSRVGIRAAERALERFEAPRAHGGNGSQAELVPLVLEAAHAEVLAREWLGEYRWAQHEGTWRRWTGRVWKKTSEPLAANAAQKVLRAHYGSQLAIGQPAAEDKRLRELHKATCRYTYVLGGLAFLKGEGGFHTEVAQWDADPYLVNCADGLLDMRTQTLRPHDPAALCTKMTRWSFTAGESTGAWQRHLERCLPDEEVRRQAQRDLGRALVGTDLEESLPIWYGTGANGKSTTARAVLQGVDEYGKVAVKDLLVASKFERHTTDLADLAGARIVIAEEVEDGKHLDEATVKKLTGGTRQKARFMRGDNFEFEQTFGIFLLVNHRPVIAGTDLGLWRRLRLVPWTESIPLAEQRPQDEMVAELMADGSWMLRWMVAGFADWQLNHHWVAEPVKAATAAYEAEQDVLSGFLRRRCTLNPHATVSVAELHGAYTADTVENGDEGIEPLGKIAFSTRLKSRNLTQTKGTAGVRVWRGIGLRGK